MKKLTTEEKYNHVINKNTYFYFDLEFEEKCEGDINSLSETLLSTQNDIVNNGLKKDIFEKLLKEKSNGLAAILALTGISNETFKRLITLIRVSNDHELRHLTYKNKWFSGSGNSEIREWTDRKIAALIQENEHFVKGVVNLVFEGSTVPFLKNTLPLFELKKFGISKIDFSLPGIVDTLVRYKSKGSYSGKLGNNPEFRIRNLLDDIKVPFTQGDLPKLVENEQLSKRTMDFIIPDKDNPIIIIESSFLSTTSSGQGDKAKVEIGMRDLINKHYPNTKFIGFVDGIGWYVRKIDLKRMVEAYEDVFTFHPDDIIRFREFIETTYK